MDSAGGTDFIVRQLWLGGLAAVEYPLPLLFARLAHGARHVFDVGANSGIYSIIAALAPASSVDAFEPFPPALVCLRRNLALNGLTDRVFVCEAAAGRECGQAELYVPTKDFGDVLETAASLNPKFRKSHSEVIRVPLLTLDEHARRRGVRDVTLMKIDVESQEHVVLEGAAGILDSSRPIVFLEVLERGDSGALEALRRRYRMLVFCLAGSAVLPCAEVRPRAEGTNQVLCPEERRDDFLGAVRDCGLEAK